MKTFLVVAVTALALAGCGPDLEGASTTSVSQALEVPVESSPPAVVSPADPRKAILAPEAPTFLSTHVYDTGIKR